LRRGRARSTGGARRPRRASAAAAATVAGETWRGRIGWSFFGVAATLGALALVASLVLDTLLFDRGLIGPQREEPGGGAPSSPDLAVTGDGSGDAVLTGALLAGRETNATARGPVDGSKTQHLSRPNRSRSRPGGSGGGGAAHSGGTSVDRGPRPSGGSSGAEDNAPAPTGPLGAGGAGSAGGAAGSSLEDVADHVGAAVEGAAGATEDCVCGAVGQAAGAVGAAAGSAGGTAGDVVQGAGEAAAGVAGAVGGEAGGAGGALPPLP
jgi:hypothetical protein